MAVDYTKVFTVIGKYGDKINDYFAHQAIYISDQGAIETILAAQDLVRLGDGLTDTYNTFKEDTTSHINELIDRVSTVLTDEALIGANFSFGQTPNLQIVWPALIHDMANNDKNVAANTGTVGSITYTATNTTVGKIAVLTTLDGTTPPMSGAQPILDYHNLESQLLPTSETLTFTCIADSESGGVQRGSELFQITGTNAASSPYAAQGENIGILGSIQCADANATSLLSNPSFDDWDETGPVGWEIVSGAIDEDFEESGTTVYGTDTSSFSTIQNDTYSYISQTIPNSLIKRRKGYMFSVWARKLTDAGGDQRVDFLIADDITTYLELYNVVKPTSTAWELFSSFVFTPIEIVGDVRISFFPETTWEAGSDAVLLDNMCITECNYEAGVAFNIFSGPEKFLLGDTIAVPLSNNDAGKFQTLARKAFKVQLPTDGTPSISDSLYA